MRCVLALALLPAMAMAYANGPFGFTCSNNFPTFDKFGTDPYKNLVHSRSVYRITYRDQYSGEMDTTCNTLTFDVIGETYTYNYKDKSGADKVVTGNLELTDRGFKLSNMLSGHLGNQDCPWWGSKCDTTLYVVYAEDNGILTRSCRGTLFWVTESTYYLSPVSQSQTVAQCASCSS